MTLSQSVSPFALALSSVNTRSRVITIRRQYISHTNVLCLYPQPGYSITPNRQMALPEWIHYQHLV